MVINWNGTGLKIIPVTKNCTKALAKSISNVVLQPGHNAIDDDVWQDLKDHVGLDTELEEGRLVEVVVFKTKEVKEEKIVNGTKKITKKTKREKVKEASNITDFEPKDAKKIIADTYNQKSLEGWLEDETRSDVRHAIQKQIEKINKEIAGE